MIERQVLRRKKSTFLFAWYTFAAIWNGVIFISDWQHGNEMWAFWLFFVLWWVRSAMRHI